MSNLAFWHGNSLRCRYQWSLPFLFAAPSFCTLACLDALPLPTHLLPHLPHPGPPYLTYPYLLSHKRALACHNNDHDVVFFARPQRNAKSAFSPQMTRTSISLGVDQWVVVRHISPMLTGAIFDKGISHSLLSGPEDIAGQTPILIDALLCIVLLHDEYTTKSRCSTDVTRIF